ncbi:prepilin-type N-terminal cleavage/methylation domain-containing protein [Parashewanella hymeniacidonis]|uniref:prepilin-type N-terminal cleavage/methylation domain-containing protein n=1 Tax=Parashewanella hymeniacidonis TaxID=2807618 RepID=UPI0023E82837|nr:prepilin-type N-terminal cleavage/methylation domain-containing protein [Parashewanella hymeniacidonis]
MKHKGFTLIELVVVIVILAVLAVIALPKFLSLSDDADKAVVEGYAGAFESAVSIAHKAWLLETKGSGAMNDLSAYGNLDTNDSGYPIGTDKDDNRTQPNSIGKGDKGCVTIWDEIMVQKDIVYLVDTTPSGDALFVADRMGNTNPYYECRYDYIKSNFNENTNVGALGFIYDSRDGQVSVFDNR